MKLYCATTESPASLDQGMHSPKSSKTELYWLWNVKKESATSRKGSQYNVGQTPQLQFTVANA